MQSHIKTNEIQLPEVSQKRLMSILRRKIMEQEREEYMFCTEFKKQYLPKVQYLAQILGLNRDEIVRKIKESLNEGDLVEGIGDEDYVFIDGVMNT